MQITYELRVEDFTQAYTAHRKSKIWWMVTKVFLWIAAFFLAVVLLGFSLRPNWQMAKALIPVFLLVPMWIAVLWLLPWWSSRRQFLQQPGAHGPRTLMLDDAGAHWKWNGGSSDIEWKNFIRSVEGKNQILFFTSPATFNILPNLPPCKSHVAWD